MLKKSAVTVAPILSLETRVTVASATAAAALSIFELAAIDLETSAAELDAVRVEGNTEIDRLLAIVNGAEDQSAAHRAQAEAIRGLVAVHG